MCLCGSKDSDMDNDIPHIRKREENKMENEDRNIERKKDHRKSFKDNAEQKKQAKKDRLAELEAQEQLTDSYSDSETRGPNIPDSPKSDRGKRGRSKERKQAVRDKRSRSRERILESGDVPKETREKRGRSKERKKDGLKDKRSKSKERYLDSDEPISNGKDSKEVKDHQKRSKSKERKEKAKNKPDGESKKESDEKETKSSFLNPKSAIGGFFARFRTPSPRPDKEKKKKDRQSLSSTENVSEPSTPSEEKAPLPIHGGNKETPPESPNPKSPVAPLAEAVPLSPSSLSPTKSLSPKSPLDGNKSFLHNESVQVVSATRNIVRERCFQFSSQDSVDIPEAKNLSFLHDSEVIATKSVSKMKNLYEALEHGNEDASKNGSFKEDNKQKSLKTVDSPRIYTPPIVSITVDQSYDDAEPIYDNVSSNLERAASCHSIASIDLLDEEPIYQEPTITKPERVPRFMHPDYRTYSIRRQTARKKSLQEQIQNTTTTSKLVTTITKECIREESIYENVEIKPTVIRDRAPSDEVSSEDTNTTDSGRPRSDESLGLSDDEWFEWSDFDDSDFEEEYEFDEWIPDNMPEDLPEVTQEPKETSQKTTETLQEPEGPEDGKTEKKRKGNQTVSKCMEGSDKRDRLHNIANELYATEQEYVNRLSILYQVSIRVASILPDGVDRQMFPGIEVMYKLHHGELLPELRKRLQNWESNKKIGDIMKKLAPFLKLYTDYVQKYDTASNLVDTWLNKSSDFNRLVKDVEANAGKCKLPIKSYMLEPVQRVPRYELLLKDYVKRLKKDSEDREDAEKALGLVTEVAQHFEKTMKYYYRMNKLIELQRELDGPVNIVSPDRELLKEGKIQKVHATSGKVVDRYAFLLNDLLLLCNDMKLAVTGVIQRFRVKVVMEVDGLQVTDGDNLDVPNTFYVKTKQKALELCTNTEEEKVDWMEAISRSVGERTRARLMRTTGGSRRIKTSKESQELGRQAPIWIHNSHVTMCMLCASPFSALRKKHHCRSCGIVVCGKCSSRTALLEYDPSKHLKVCDECFLLLNERCGDPDKPYSPAKVKDKDKSTMSGYMQMSNDGGRTWRKRWFMVHENGFLYSFKANQDIKPTSGLPLKGCTFTIAEETQQNKTEAVICLSNENKTYFFREESLDKVPRWTVAFSKAAKDSSKEDTEPKTVETDV